MLGADPHPGVAWFIVAAAVVSGAFAVVNIFDAVADMAEIGRRARDPQRTGIDRGGPRWWQAVKEVVINAGVVVFLVLIGLVASLSLKDLQQKNGTVQAVILWGLVAAILAICVIPPASRYFRRRINEDLPLPGDEAGAGREAR